MTFFEKTGILLIVKEIAIISSIIEVEKFNKVKRVFAKFYRNGERLKEWSGPYDYVYFLMDRYDEYGLTNASLRDRVVAVVTMEDWRKGIEVRRRHNA